MRKKKNDSVPKKMEFLTYLINETKDADRPVNLLETCKKFINEVGSSDTVKCFRDRISKFRHRLHEIPNIDTATKVKLIFVLSAPLNYGFLNHLKEKKAVVELDYDRRIIKFEYQGLKLGGSHPLVKPEVAKREKDLMECLREASCDAEDHISDRNILADYKKKYGFPGNVAAITEVYWQVKADVFGSPDYDLHTKIRMLFVSRAQIQAHEFESLQSHATTIQLGKDQQIIKYIDDDGLHLETRDQKSFQTRRGVVEQFNKRKVEDEDEDLGDRKKAKGAKTQNRRSRKRVLNSDDDDDAPPAPPAAKMNNRSNQNRADRQEDDTNRQEDDIEIIESGLPEDGDVQLIDPPPPVANYVQIKTEGQERKPFYQQPVDMKPDMNQIRVATQVNQILIKGEVVENPAVGMQTMIPPPPAYRAGMIGIEERTRTSRLKFVEMIRTLVDSTGKTNMFQVNDQITKKLREFRASDKTMPNDQVKYSVNMFLTKLIDYAVDDIDPSTPSMRLKSLLCTFKGILVTSKFEGLRSSTKCLDEFIADMSLDNKNIYIENANTIVEYFLGNANY